MDLYVNKSILMNTTTTTTGNLPTASGNPSTVVDRLHAQLCTQYGLINYIKYKMSLKSNFTKFLKQITGTVKQESF